MSADDPKLLRQDVTDDEVPDLVEIKTGQPLDKRPMSVSELITMCNEAASKMSANNDHRLLMFNCAYALRQLVDRLDFYENPARIQ